ncbi:hypothetical protein ATANTOWER_014952 [Ataeniobius toweri]|uniref:Uncharacterized protein n=1 Tax=Ataeniobius toweri TaxID=208326 RepID=A0ABU7CKS1_9TELE|nr:hypothetical protein [Ataeniobius toweri]
MCVAPCAQLLQNPGAASDAVLRGGGDAACGEVEGAAADGGGGVDWQSLLRSHRCKKPLFWECLWQLCCKEPFKNAKMSTGSKSGDIGYEITPLRLIKRIKASAFGFE